MPVTPKYSCSAVIGRQDDKEILTGSTSIGGTSNAHCMQQPSLQLPAAVALLPGTTSIDQAQHPDHSAFPGNQQNSPYATNAEDSSNAHQTGVRPLHCKQTAAVQMHSDAAIAAHAVQGASADAGAGGRYNGSHSAGEPLYLPTTTQLPASLLRYDEEWALKVCQAQCKLCQCKHCQLCISQETCALVSLHTACISPKGQLAQPQAEVTVGWICCSEVVPGVGYCSATA